MTDCPHPKSAKAKRCRSCNCKAQWADPHFRANKARSNARTLAKLREDPAFIERERARQADGLAKMIATKACATPDAIRKRVASYQSRKMAWCPPRLRSEYFRLMKNQHLPAAEAKRIMLDHILREGGLARAA